MPQIPDLVRDSQLETQFYPEHTEHIYYETGPTACQRTIRREELWSRESYVARGAYGSVWLEQCAKGGSEIKLRAVKQIQKAKQTTKPIDFTRELEAIAIFSHKRYERCFVRSFGWYEDANAVFISMEYLPLGDLHIYLSGVSPLPETEAQQITFEVLEGLSFMHESGFAHRDLKPRNILVKSAPPDGWWVKIGDFGISKRAEDSLAASSTLQGTLGFLAPELHGFVESGRLLRPLDAKAADMWALGEIAFQMLTKEPAFRDLGQLYKYAHSSQPFPLAVLLDHAVSLEGRDFITRVMLPIPERRPAATDALRHDWIALHYSSHARPSTVMVESSQTSRELLAPFASDVPIEPSASWSTLEVPGIRVGSSTAWTPATSAQSSALGWVESNCDLQRGHTTEGMLASRSSLPRNRTASTQGLTQEETHLGQVQVFASAEPVNDTTLDATTSVSKIFPILHFTESWGRSLRGHLKKINSVAFSPDGKVIASSSDDGSVRLWDIMLGLTRRAHTQYWPTHRVLSVAYSPDGKLFVSGSTDKKLRLWDTAKAREPLWESRNYLRSVKSVAVSSDGKFVATASGRKVRLWNVRTGRFRGALQSHRGIVRAVAFSPDAKLIASGSDDHTVMVWDAVTGMARKTMVCGLSAVRSIAFSPDGRLIASGGDAVRLWDVSTGSMQRELKGVTGQSESVAFSPDGKLVASSWDYNTLRLWDVETGVARAAFTGHPTSIHSVAFSPDSKLLASGSDDKSIKLWDVGTGLSALT